MMIFESFAEADREAALLAGNPAHAGRAFWSRMIDDRIAVAVFSSVTGKFLYWHGERA